MARSTVCMFGSSTAYSRMMFTIDRIDRMPTKISYPVFLSSLPGGSALAMLVLLVRSVMS